MSDSMNDPMGLELEYGEVIEVCYGNHSKVCLSATQGYESLHFGFTVEEARHLASALLRACDESNHIHPLTPWPKE